MLHEQFQFMGKIICGSTNKILFTWFWRIYIGLQLLLFEPHQFCENFVTREILFSLLLRLPLCHDLYSSCRACSSSAGSSCISCERLSSQLRSSANATSNAARL